ncbi:MAG: response regulator transcription factor [Ignavibacteria bacterium]|nr:response regulator transcription factor [Ignavibacteria bacterium]
MYIRVVSVLQAADWVHVQNNFAANEQHTVGFVANLTSVEGLVQACVDYRPDAVIIDPAIDNGEILTDWRENFSAPPQLICVSADVSFAVQAFEAGAVHYLLLPCTADMAGTALRRLHRRLISPAVQEQTAVLREVRPTTMANIITLPDSYGYEVRSADKIVCARAEGAYTRFIFEQEPQVLVSKSLGECEQTLTDVGMLRVHRSHMVSIAHIRKVARGKTSRVILSTGDQLSIGNSYLEQLITALNVAGRRRS